jgi:hypothetical protein
MLKKKKYKLAQIKEIKIRKKKKKRKKMMEHSMMPLNTINLESYLRLL